MHTKQTQEAAQPDRSAFGKRRLRDQSMTRFSLALAVIGALLLLAGLAYPETIRPMRGIEMLCIAYLLLLVSMYQVGDPVTTRGAIVKKLESPWTYRFCFVPFSTIGTVPIFILLGNDVFGAAPCTSFLMYLDALTALLAGMCVLLGLSIFWIWLVTSTVIGTFRFLQKALGPK